MSQPTRWALSPLDCQVHLLAPADHPWGVLKARCGHLLPPGARRHECSPQGAHRTCPTCATIARRPTTIPEQRWVRPQDTPRPTTNRVTVVGALWGRCPVDGLLHLLIPRAVCQLTSQGCAAASCGTVLATQNLVVRGWGTPCLACLRASAS